MALIALTYPLIETPPALTKPFFEMNKREADLYLEWFVSIKKERLLILFNHVNRKEEWQNDSSRKSLDALFLFFKDHLSERNMTWNERANTAENIQGTLKGNIAIPVKILDEKTVSICFDVGLYFGETLIKNVPNLKWTNVLTPKRYVHYAQPIIVKEGNRVDLNPRAVIEVLARKVVGKDQGSLVDLYDIWKKIFS